ncbi:hypothetical protein [Gracilibacillus saliphilus]|uniref:hypothetical protein n=1 Tax=Gracilibacillus saliphilus TaxID=543890 RepID=UPI0013D895E8|nr:hypothetical protein [Gracilibacillus saliphilus]
MLKDHPDIEGMQQKGFIFPPVEQSIDSMGNTMKPGDPVLKLNGKVFAENELTLNEQLILCECGAVEDEA